MSNALTAQKKEKKKKKKKEKKKEVQCFRAFDARAVFKLRMNSLSFLKYINIYIKIIIIN
jgi:hypothetical protein